MDKWTMVRDHREKKRQAVRKKERIKVNLRMKQKTPFDTNSNVVNDVHIQ